MTGTQHYLTGQKKLKAAEDMLAMDTLDAIAVALFAIAHYQAAQTAIAAQAAGLSVRDSRGPSDWWTALYGEEAR